MKNNTKLTVCAVAISAAILGGAGVVSGGFLPENKAYADVSNINLNVPVRYADSLATTEVFDIKVPKYSEGAIMHWGAAGTTQVIASAGTTEIANSQFSNGNNKAFSNIKVGDTFRLTNTGITSISKTKLDTIIEITSINHPQTPSIAFYDASETTYNPISINYWGAAKVGLKVKIVKSGTTTPVTITTAGYFSDIDGHQGVVENYSKDLRIYRKNSMDSHLKVDPKNNAVYDINDNYNGVNPYGMATPEIGSYIGAGTFSEFELDYYNNYLRPDVVTGGMPGLQFDILGKFENINLIQEKQTITVTYKYQDEDGNKISPDVQKEQTTPDADPSTKKEIPPYSFVEIRRGENNTFIYVYKRPIKTSFIDENGKEIKVPSYGEKGGDPDQIEGYEFIETRKTQNGDIEHVYRKISIKSPDTGVNSETSNEIFATIFTSILAIGVAIFGLWKIKK